MKRDLGSTLTTLLTARRENLHLAIIALVAATGIGVFAGALTVIFEKSIATLAVVSGFVILSTAVYLLRDLSRRLAFQDEVTAAIAFNGKDGRVIPLSRYRFSDEFVRTLRAVEAESKAIHADWTRDPICEGKKPSSAPAKEGDAAPKKLDAKSANKKDASWIAVTRIDAPDSREIHRPQSVNLLEEIVEYIILERLSTHLSTYFNDYEEDKFITEMKRNDIPDFLLENRVLNLLTTPLEQRDIFIDAFPDPNKRPEGEIYSLYGSNGAIYSRFDLRLPFGSTVEKSGESGFVITTSRFTLRVQIKYTGFNKVVPIGYSELYLDIPYRDLITRSISISMSGRVKAFSLLRAKGWKYYTWLDSFRDDLYESFNFESYFDQIRWDIVEPIFKVGIPMMRKFQRSATKAQKTANPDYSSSPPTST